MTILDANRNELARAEPRFEADPLAAILTNVDRPKALLSYYFGNGARCVTLAELGLLMEGQLRTRWESSRRLWVMEPKRAIALGAGGERAA